LTHLSAINTVFILAILTSCGQEKQAENEAGKQKTVIQAPKTKPIPVDYKSDTYKISLGDNYKIRVVSQWY
jgi:hypothetical protein